MGIKKALFNIKGMTRDLAASKFNPEFAYENRNMRILATDDNTSGTLTNERGNLKIEDGIFSSGFYGIPIGQATIDDELVLFTTEKYGEEPDSIYKVYLDADNNLVGEVLYNGDLGFSADNPIESISVYESNQLKKVYWTDGLNQPRVINIEAPVSTRERWNNDTFNFIRKLKLKEEISIERNLVSSGYFAPGVLQYCFTYFDLYGQETNIFYTSPLFYVSYNNRGGSETDTVANSFTINVSNPDTNFSYLRIYSILRTSLNGTPQVRKVTDLTVPINGSDIIYTDTGTDGSTVDPMELLYVGGEEVIVGTLGQKDNTLFLGDLEVKRKILSATVRDGVANGTIHFDSSHREDIDVGAPSGLYPYQNQLKSNSHNIKTLKYLEYYRFGLQAQHYTGKWSEPIWINDDKNTAHPNITSDGQVYLPYAWYRLSDSDVIEELIANGYVRVRPVIVFPEINEREAVCQGVLCPTVYNVGDRAGNAPFSQASWFFRPSSYLDVVRYQTDYTSPSGTNPRESYAAQVRNDMFFTTPTPTTEDDIVENFLKGKWVEFRHNHPIPDNDKENAEIQCITNAPATPYITGANTSNAESWAAYNHENFYVDQSIVTLNSPDIEFDKQVRSLDVSGLKLRIIGAINLTASSSDISIQSETPVNNYFKKGGDNPEYYKEFPVGFYKEGISTENNSKFGWRSIVSGAFWIDDVSAPMGGVSVIQSGEDVGFVIYPWHRSMSYNNATAVDKDGYVSAKVGKKKLSVLRYSFFNTYLDSNEIWNAYRNGYSEKTGISDVAIFDSDEVSMIKLRAQQNSGLGSISYYGNIDRLITYPNYDDKKDGYPIITTLKGKVTTESIDLGSGQHVIMSWNYSKPDEPWYHWYPGYTPSSMDDFNELKHFTTQHHALDPVYIKYKSTPHAVIALNYATNGDQRILPTALFANSVQNFMAGSHANYAFWDKNKVSSGVSQDYINKNLEYGYLWIGELYNDSVSNRFGGLSEGAFEQNKWLPAGDAVSLIDGNNSPVSSIDLIWTEGDTYYQRYDCLKTYPFTMEDQNSIVDILSFMCETRVNVDGRYDRNRGQASNLVMSPTNFNLLNTAYSQPNNFFTYNTINPTKINESTFPNTITWTKTKTLGEEVDTWTNITLASTLDLDGDLGKVNAIRRFNDSILAFQDNGVSQILYNENVQIASTTGVPIEIANSGKVSGKRYVSNKIGCTNKWSICSTPNGLYFFDGLSKDLYLFNGEFNNLSDKFGFHSWAVTNLNSIKPWTPTDFDGCITYYDKVNNDVLFITKDDCLAFSETLGQFSSFYDYGDTPLFANIKDKGIAIHKEGSSDAYYPFLHHEGEYNVFYETLKPYWTTVIVNDNPTTDKIFNNLEFRADSFDDEDTYVKDYTFDYLNVWNEHQEGEADLSTIGIFGSQHSKDAPSSLKKKFRTWRANIPRWNVDKNGQTANCRDRMRNPWLYLKLAMKYPDDLSAKHKTVLHDLVVDYFE